jgi:FkbM family methyltransferase
MIRQLLSIGFKRNLSGVGHLARFYTRNELVPYIKAKLIENLTFYADPRHYTDQIILRTQQYEFQVKLALISSIKHDDVFWDIGANTGYHSMVVKKLSPRTEVVCFEPNPEVFLRLEYNLRSNALECLLFPVALGANVILQQLNVVVNGNSGLTTLIQDPNAHYDFQMQAMTFTGDFFVSNLFVSSPNIVKLDVEGFELEVLRGMSRILESGSLRTIIFEAHNLLRLKEIADYLTGYGFGTAVSLGDGLNYVIQQSPKRES